MSDNKQTNSFDFRKLAFWLFIFFVALLPFQAFLLTWIRHQLNLSSGQFFIMSLWKEFLLGIILFIAGLKISIDKKRPVFKILTLDKVILSFGVLFLIYFVFFGGSLAQKIAGLRYDLEFFLIYFLARFFNFDNKQLKSFFKIFLLSSVPVVTFGLLQIVLSPSFLISFGYSPTLSEYMKTGIIPTYDAINPSLPNLYRVQSTFPGALQFSSYLLVVASFGISTFLIKKDKYKFYALVLFVLSLVAISVTYTRSAWLGILAAIFVVLLVYVRRKMYVILPSLLFILAGSFFIFSFFNFKPIQTLLLHGEIRDNTVVGSTESHQNALSESIGLIKNNPLGRGIGAAGPASKLSEEVIISESSYLQIVLEVGILGLVLFILVVSALFKYLYTIFKKAKDSINKSLSLGLIGALLGISVSSLFLHTWADTATAYLFWFFVGLVVSGFEKDNISASKAQG